jgi:hypothetical protein
MKTLMKSLFFVALSCSIALANDETAVAETSETIDGIEAVETVTVDDTAAQVVELSPDAPVERTSASASEMAGIWHSMHWAKTDSGRLTVLRAVARGYWLSVMQVEVLLETISDRQNRVTMLAQLYPKITNPQQVDRLQRLLPAGVNPRNLISAVRVEETAQL